MRSAPQVMFSERICLIRAMISGVIRDCGVLGLDLRRQIRRNSWRCHRRRVSG